jgi:hypothetical protein
MTMTKTWNVAVTLTEDAGRTRAEAHLHGAGAGELGAASSKKSISELRAVGMARCHPDDADVPMIGDEVAVSRALSDLAHQLLDTAARNIESRTGRKADVLL